MLKRTFLISLNTHSNLTPRRFFSTTFVPNARKQRRLAPLREKAGYDVERMDEYRFDDMTSTGQEILWSQREVRKYLRKTKYEIPQLNKFIEPFIPPKKSQILCFQTQWLIGEPSPIEKKVVLTFQLSDLILQTQMVRVQAHKFIVLCGPHYNLPKGAPWKQTFNDKEWPFRGSLKFVCDKFPHQAQNKKYLSDLLDRLVNEAKDMKDTFADIPIDLRHIKRKHPNYIFPKEWLIQAPQGNKLPPKDESKPIIDFPPPIDEPILI
ncbi:hypothetical protein G9A89_010058 [Geosiphon pyriformis]|nr:hypothetical protein G9A89_010058 [Geosiphon pyriformis]